MFKNIAKALVVIISGYFAGYFATFVLLFIALGGLAGFEPNHVVRTIIHTIVVFIITAIVGYKLFGKNYSIIIALALFSAIFFYWGPISSLLFSV